MTSCLLGANGYLGRHLARALAEQGTDLILSDRAPAPILPHGPYVSADVRDREAMARLLDGANLVYYFAGASGTAAGFDDYRTFVETNEIGLLNVLDVLRHRQPPPKIVFPSTRLVYRGSPDLLTEESPNEFKTIYAMNKFAGERYLEMYARCFAVRFVVLRICVPYGSVIPGRRSSYGTVAAFIDQASRGEDVVVFGGGEQKRSLIHIEDLTQLIVKAANHPATDGHTYNAGGADTLSISEIAESIAELFGVRVEYRPWPELITKIESADTVFDSTRLEGLLGYSYRTTFRRWLVEYRRERLTR